MGRIRRLAGQLRALIPIAALQALIACAQPPHAEQQSDLLHDLAEFWQEPVDLAARDLFAGPGGSALAPPATGGRYEFLAFKTAGTNPGYDVRDASGRVWSVKLGIEAQPEVTASRILWAMGYHQPPQYFVHEFTLTGTDAGVKTRARFRSELNTNRWKSVGEWSWYDNPFINTRQFGGLVVAQLVLSNWDLKTPNNRLYESASEAAKPRRIFMVRDLGASLGESKQFALFTLLRTPGSQGSKNDIDGFERQGFINQVEGDQVSFDYRGPNQPLVDRITVADVVWACEQLAKIPDTHWQAAFNAGAFAPDITARYITKIKQKIAQGLALKGTTTR